MYIAYMPAESIVFTLEGSNYREASDEALEKLSRSNVVDYNERTIREHSFLLLESGKFAVFENEYITSSQHIPADGAYYAQNSRSVRQIRFPDGNTVDDIAQHVYNDTSVSSGTGWVAFQVENCLDALIE